MSDISYNNELSDAAILSNIGGFVKKLRIDQGLTQEDVAKEAAISRSTLSLIERGENVALINVVKILRVLNALYVLDQFEVKQQISPMQLAKAAVKSRKRASKNSTQINKEDLGW